MKVLVIGGAGKQGAGAAKVMAEKDTVSKVIVADINVDGAKKVASKIGGKAKAAYLDLDDRTSLLKLMVGADIVINLAGPGFKYAALILQAALEARLNYIDIQDDGEAIPALLAFDEAAQNAGLTMVTGMGLTPGVSNLLAICGANKIDQVEEIRIAWIADVTPAPTIANWGHRLGMYGSEVPIFDDGQVTSVRGGTGEETVEWPQPIGTAVERFTAHTEPLTLPRYIKKGLRHVSVKGAFIPQEHDEFVAYLASLGFASLKPVKIGEASITPIDFIRNFLVSDDFRSTNFYKNLMDRERAIGETIGLRVEIKGLDKSKPTRLVYIVFSRTDRNPWIYTPACVVADMVLSGKIRQKGVICPEALDPEPILSELARSGLIYKEIDSC